MKVLLPFDLVYATSVNDAVSKLVASKGNAVILAGGTDLLGVMKSRVLPNYPQTVISLKKIPNLDYIKEENQLLKIGAMAKLADIAESDVVRSHYSALSKAAGAVASPQIRNMGTIGGNLCQQVRCWYFRYPHEIGGRIQCIRKGGATCYAAAGEAHYHSIFGGEKGCFAVAGSDTATALVALNAKIVTNRRTIGIEQFFDSLKGTVLEPSEILTAIQIPRPPAESKQSFIKFTGTKGNDLSLVNVASLLTMNGSTCKNARIALGGVAPVPWRPTKAEASIIGQVLDANSVANAANASVADVFPLEDNGYKVPLAKSLVSQALLT
jgi:xanthine dehydrogenase YagS FAD-binding subunit